MTAVVIFPSVLGVRAGVRDLADLVEQAGHSARVIDQYAGRVFDDYQAASAFADGIGFPALMRAAEEAVADLPDGFLVAGFSNGAGMAEYIATRRRVSGAILFGGGLPLEYLGAEAWPQAVPVQLHATRDDPFWDEGSERFAAEVVRAQAAFAFHPYPGSGHLFTDPTLSAEYDADATDLAYRRVLAFLTDRKV